MSRTEARDKREPDLPYYLLAFLIASGEPVAQIEPDGAQDRQAEAQPTDYENAPPPAIVVSGSSEDEGKTVIVGSRIPRKSQFSGGQFATNTRLHGFTPGSGVDPQTNFTRIIRTTECRADDPAIGEKAACLLLSARKDFANGETDAAIDVLRHLAMNGDFSAEERMAGAQALFAHGRTSDDARLRRHALRLMLETGSLSPARSGSALRSIAAISNRLGDVEGAIGALQELDALGTTRPRDLANLAIFLRQAGRSGAAQTMERAIALSEADGSEAPRGWRDFARMPLR